MSFIFWKTSPSYSLNPKELKNLASPFSLCKNNLASFYGSTTHSLQAELTIYILSPPKQKYLSTLQFCLLINCLF